MTDKHDDLPALLANPAVKCGEYAGPPGEGARENYYDSEQMQAAYSAGQRAAALRAAQVCREQASSEPNDVWASAYRHVSDDCAAAILRDAGVKEHGNADQA